MIIGRFNITDEYFGTRESAAWWDLGLKVEGESVAALSQYFDDLFAWTRETITYTHSQLHRTPYAEESTSPTAVSAQPYPATAGILA